MRLEWIEDILAVLEAGSFSGAADRRRLTPSAFTRRIRGIEEALGAPLFDRNRKPVTLLPHVRNMEGALRDAARQLRDLRLGLAETQGQGASRLSLGCQHALSTMVSPWLVSSLGRRGEIAMRVRSGTRSECQLMLLRREVDVGLIYETPEDALQFDSGLFEKVTLGHEALIPVAAAGRFDATATTLPIVMYPADIYLGEVLKVQILPHLPRGVSTYPVAETGLTPAVLQFVRHGLGVGWLPRSVAHEAIARGELTDLAPDLPVAWLTVQAVRARAGGSDLVRDAWARLTREAASINVPGIVPIATS